MRHFLLLMTTLLFFSVAQAETLPPTEAGAVDELTHSSRHGEWIKYDAGMGDQVDAWVVYPERADKAPVVILVHEIFGLRITSYNVCYTKLLRICGTAFSR